MNKRNHYLLLVSFILVAASAISCGAHRAGSSEDETAKIELLFEEDPSQPGLTPGFVRGFFEKSIPVQAAWRVYANSLKKLLEDTAMEYGFGHELEARQTLLASWRNAKEEDSGVLDGTLDDLMAVEEAGYMNEYLWRFFADPEWGAAPEGLRGEEFDVWQKEALTAIPPEQPVVLIFTAPQGSPIAGRLYPIPSD